jgi:Xaa-Pro aminopeptidase
VIEAERLAAEEVGADAAIVAAAWQDPSAREAFVRDTLAPVAERRRRHLHTVTGAARRRAPASRAWRARVASDRPVDEEVPLPASLVEAKRRLGLQEVVRYRALGSDAARAVSEALLAAAPEWTEHRLAAAAAAALLGRGIAPALVLAAGERRLPLYRHPTPSAERLGRRAMVVVCARRHGLYANLTRFVAFSPPDDAERARHDAVRAVEAAAWEASRPGATLGQVYGAIAAAYARAGHPGAEDAHHQGGTTGYLSREVVARPGDATRVEVGTPLAFNPSLPGAKVEDTVVVGETGLEILTVDPAWPTVLLEGRPRPAVLVR